jgi:hypothetical protein
MRATVIRWKDATSKLCYNSLGERFRLADYLSTTEVPFYAIVENKLMQMAVSEEVDDDTTIEYTIEVPTIVGAFQKEEELIEWTTNLEHTRILSNALRVRG